MSLNSRMIKDEDFKDIAEWWTSYDFPILQKEMLPPNGFIVEEEQNKIAATWVFRTDAPVYIITWFVGNPKVHFTKRSEGLDLLIDVAADWAKQDGAKVLFTTTGHKRLIEKLKDNKFELADEDTVNLVRRL